jgi:hypothetical protein
VTAQLSLFRGPQARATDPATSHEAAAAVTPAASELENDILACLRVFGPLTDDEICQRLDAEWWPTVKTARSRLLDRGLVMPTGEKRMSVRNRPQQVWSLPCR